MKSISALGLVLAALAIGACGKSEQTGPQDASKDSGTKIAAAAPDGKSLFVQCRACHSLKKGELNRLGPNLYGIFGMTAGKKEGFTYSAAMATSKIVWTPETMDAWIEKPREYIPGTKMVYAGMAKAEDRTALIEYLQKETK
jgi:cytochrome c